jgi:hypothetical protein
MTDSWTPYRFRQLEALLTDRDVRILEELERYRALDTRLIQRLLFPAGQNGPHATAATATRLAVRVLLRLESHGFIGRLERRVGGALRGSASSTWHLAATGERFLRARRGEPGRRRLFTPSRAFLAHTLEVAALAVSLHEKASSGALDVLELEPEPACWRTFNGPGGLVMLKPDLYAVLADETLEAHSFVEIDRDTEHLPAIVKKCRLYQQYRQTGAEQQTVGLFPTVLWVVPTANRAAQLRAAIHSDRSIDRDLFTVCQADEAVDALSTSLTLKGGTQ